MGRLDQTGRVVAHLYEFGPRIIVPEKLTQYGRRGIPMLEAPGKKESARFTTSTVGRAWGAAFFVWAIWALMVVAGFGYVWKYGRNVPFYDEWGMVYVLTGDQPVNARWLWSEHNGHRIPLPRLLLLGLYRLTNSDFRAGMYFNVFTLGALAFTMIRVARGIRGEGAYTDAIFPLALLHWGHYENLLWSWQVTQVTPVLLASILLLIIVHRGARLTLASVVLAGMCLAALPLCGVPGLAYVPPLALWLGYVGLLDWRSGERQARRRSLTAWSLTAAAILLSVLYFVDYHEPARHWSELSLRDCATTSLAFLAGGLGPAATRFQLLLGLGVFALLLASAGALLVALWRNRPPGRPRAVGLLCFLAAVACLGLSVGLGRTRCGFTPRYFLFAVPALCCAYFIWGVYSRPAVGHFAQTCLFTLIASTCALNFQAGHDYARTRRDQLDAFERELLAGEPTYQLLARHTPALCPCPWGEGISFHDWLDYCLRALCQSGIGPFRFLQLERPVLREISVPIAPLTPDRERENTRAGSQVASDMHQVLPLAEPRFVCGIRVTCRMYSSSTDGSPHLVQVYWKREGQSTFTDSQRYWIWASTKPPAGEQVFTFWVYDSLDQLQIYLKEEPGVFKLSEIVLLVPASGEVSSSHGND